MDKLIGPYRPHIYTLLRIASGLLFAAHGAQKLFGALGGRPAELVSQMGLAGVIEFIGGLMIALGLFTDSVTAPGGSSNGGTTAPGSGETGGPDSPGSSTTPTRPGASTPKAPPTKGALELKEPNT